MGDEKPIHREAKKVLNRMTKWAAGILIASSLTTMVWAQAAAPQWKDQGESDIGLSIPKETDPAKKLELLKKWEQQYPESAFQAQRTLMSAQALLAVLGAAYNKPAGDPSLAAGQKAGQQLIDKMDTYFAPSVKPDTLTDKQWTDARKASELQIHSILANIAQTNKDDPTAEAEYKKALALDPTQASTSYYLGSTIIREIIKTKDYTRFSEALYDLARSLAVTGPTELPAAGKAAATKALTTNYNNYHGDSSGMPELIKQAADSPQMPAGFHILSVIEIDEAKQKDHAAWAAAHPELEFWELIRETLKAKGDDFFATFKDVGVPPAPGETYKGGPMLKGTVVSQTAKDILVNVESPAGDCTLKFEDGVSIKGTIPPGTAIQFKGVVDSYVKEPYNLAILIQEPKDDLVGIPADVTFPLAAGKTGAKPATGAKKAAPKAPAKKAVAK